MQDELCLLQVLTRSHFYKASARPWQGLRCKGKRRDALENVTHLTTGQFLFPQAGNPDPTGWDDHGAAAAAPRPAPAEGVHRGAQRLHRQLQVMRHCVHFHTMSPD